MIIQPLSKWDVHPSRISVRRGKPTMKVSRSFSLGNQAAFSTFMLFCDNKTLRYYSILPD